MGIDKGGLSVVLLCAGSSSRFIEGANEAAKKQVVKKQWLRINHEPLCSLVARRFRALLLDATIYMVVSKTELVYARASLPRDIIDGVIEGGATRQESLANALQVVTTEYVMISDIARYGIDGGVLDRLFGAMGRGIDCVVPTLGLKDTIVHVGCMGQIGFHSASSTLAKVDKTSVQSELDSMKSIESKLDSTKSIESKTDSRVDKTKGVESKMDSMNKTGDIEGKLKSPSLLARHMRCERDEYLSVQTPQLSRTAMLKSALAKNSAVTFSDDSSLILEAGGSVAYVRGSHALDKLTYRAELPRLYSWLIDEGYVDTISLISKGRAQMQGLTLTGQGYDVHELYCPSAPRALLLCGVEIDSKDARGLALRAHSDGDVAIHSVIDALLGASGGGDIGEYFSDKDARYKDYSSREMLLHICSLLRDVGYEIVNVDLTIIAESIKITPYKAAMRDTMCNLLGLLPMFFNIKATTNEKLGYLGKDEGICVQSVVTLRLDSV